MEANDCYHNVVIFCGFIYKSYELLFLEKSLLVQCRLNLPFDLLISEMTF